MRRANNNNNKNRGAITVFLAVIFMSLILLAGAIIDIARILAADSKIRQALNSSARSVLAGYDRELAGDYGIFALNAGSAAHEELYRYLRINLKEYHEGIGFLDIKADAEDAKLRGVECILSDEAFKRQVLEYMKYRVPINAAESVIEQLKALKLDKKTAFVKSEKETRIKAKELREKVNDLNSKLAGAGKKLTELSAGKLKGLKDELEEALTINNDIFFGGDQSLLNQYRQSLESTNEAAREAECVENLSKEFENVMTGDSDVRAMLEKYYSEVSSTISEVEPLMEELDDLKGEISELKHESEESVDRLRELHEKAEELEAIIDEKVSELESSLDGKALTGYSLKDESTEPPSRESGQFIEFIKKAEKEIKDKLTTHIEKDWLISMDEFEKNSLIEGEFFNAGNAYDEPRPNMKETEAEKRNDVVIENLEKLLQTINDAAANTVEKMYLIEYVMDKYTFLTSKTDRAHHFRKGEIEYILAGTDAGESYSVLENTEHFVIAKVLLQVWTMRFAIDAIDNFIGSSVVFPPERLAFSLMEGAVDSSIDMFNLLNGEAIPICPKSFTAVKLKYSDHLRILLFMKPEQEILRKARQLMQVNIKHTSGGGRGSTRGDFSLGNYSTIIKAEVEARVNLLFLPLLQLDKLAPKLFDNGRYVIRKQIFMGY